MSGHVAQQVADASQWRRLGRRRRLSSSRVHPEAGRDRVALEVHASLGLTAGPRSAGTARRFITDFCIAADLDEDVRHKAALLTSELVTNAIRYGGSHALLEARMPSGSLRIAVHDANPGLPVLGTAPDLTAEGGRGVQLLTTLADRWGVEATASGGKAVWLELDVPGERRAPATASERRATAPPRSVHDHHAEPGD